MPWPRGDRVPEQGVRQSVCAGVSDIRAPHCLELAAQEMGLEAPS